MKIKVLLLTFLFSMALVTACDKDDDPKVVSSFETALNEKYPGATKVEWEKEQDWMVAEFHWKGREYEVWYDKEATWLMTVIDDVLYQDFPEAVKSSFESGDYAGWKTEDVEIIELKELPTLYLIEVEQGKTEYDLYYLEDGLLTKVIDDDTHAHWKHLIAFLQQ